MSLIVKPENKRLDPRGKMEVPAMEIPSFRFLLSQESRTLKNILIKTPYAIGDCICAEPAIRYAAKNFQGCTISLSTPYPELYRHIPIKKIYNAKLDEKPNWGEYYVYECYHSADALQSEFVHNFNMAIEDYISVCLFKGMIPVADRNIVLKPTAIEEKSFPPFEVVIHAGKHWASKTFPKKWWDLVIHHLLAEGIKPALIGAKIDGDKRGYVEVDSTHCIDLRDKLTIMQSVSVLQRAAVVITNDSAPYHMAASGSADIGLISTVRHPDWVGHWRPMSFENPFSNITTSQTENRWMHKIENLSKGWLWQDSDVTPARNGGKYDMIAFETLMSFLPEPIEVCEWVKVKLGRA